MKNIDSDIEQFEKNLIEIDTMRKQISELNISLCEVLNETRDIDSIKENLIKEIEAFHETNDNSIKQIDEKIEELKKIAEDVKNSMGKDTDKIVKPIKEELSDVMKQSNQISETFEKYMNDIKLKQELIEKKINTSIAIIVVGFVLSLILIIVR
ncbi:MAG: hypothetical protein MR765_06395 [Tenericutes bacterium]|nr:hypothetical protein [Mycoplasmatota bacterium]